MPGSSTGTSTTSAYRTTPETTPRRPLSPLHALVAGRTAGGSTGFLRPSRVGHFLDTKWPEAALFGASN